MTPAERRLWEALRARQAGGLKFPRQHPVGPFVLDFVCPTAKLVVELDGPIHDSRLERDTTRTDHLALYGYRVIRFRNEDVMARLEGVLSDILAAANERSTLPSPKVGGGAGGEGP